MRMKFIKGMTFCGAKVSHMKYDGSNNAGYMARKSSKRLCGDGMHFYCQAKKVGTLNIQTNYPAFEAFNVNPRWISTWYNRGKISWTEANTLFVNTGQNIRSYLNNLQFLLH